MNDRQFDAVASLGLAAGMSVLEIGCGPGVAATYVCERIGPSGKYVGVDRSQKAITMALRRNAAYIPSGNAVFEQQELDALALSGQHFDIIFAIRVGLFHRQPERAQALVAPYLAPGGRVVSIYDTPGQCR